MSSLFMANLLAKNLALFLISLLFMANIFVKNLALLYMDVFGGISLLFVKISIYMGFYEKLAKYGNSAKLYSLLATNFCRQIW